jgi:hypothetical protein
MRYEKGSIISRKDIKFKGNNLLDTRAHGHPVSILLETDFMDDHVFFLSMGSDPRFWVKNPKRYLPIKPNKRDNCLRKPSYIDLQYVYKYDKKNIPETGCLSIEDYSMLIHRLIDYQRNIHRDIDFNEIENQLAKSLN